MKLNVQKLHPDAVVPYYDHPGDAGLAVHTVEGRVLDAGERYAFDTGWALEFPAGHVAMILDRSGLSLKAGLKTMAGVGDANYRGSYRVVMINLSHEAYEVKKGDKIAQLLVIPLTAVDIVETDALSDTSRGDKGFGSTGR